MASNSKRAPWRAKTTSAPSRAMRTFVRWGREPHWSTKRWREAIKPLSVYYARWDSCDDGTEVRHVKVSSDFIKAAGRNLQSALRHELGERGLIRPSDCNCSHCAADYDCCGRIIGGPVRMSRLKGRTYRIEQSIYTNV